MGKNTSRVQIWHRIFHQFNKTRLRYVLVGGAALVVHGLPRSTLDIDIYVPAKEGVLSKLFQTADKLGLQSEERNILNIKHSPELFIGQWICFSYKGQDVLDVFFAAENEFKKLYGNSEQKRDKKISIRVASVNDIAAMKKASGRPIDSADLEFIKEAKKYKRKSATDKSC